MQNTSLSFDDSKILAQGNSSSYLVLARKYRPTSLKDMVGQDVLVKTLTNAVSSSRISHAFILTGIRGVGKTTTARIIARALNCTGADGNSNITVNPCGVCIHCKAIAEDRHQDVLEMDAASHTGVSDIREIIENCRYKPISGRYKVFIIDEVHMLSNSAFNALLKTLEEPPAHVKFIFATTEIRKVPITILSRCQKFDLKRVEVSDLVNHFKNILSKEQLQADEDALKLIAINAGGSVRDGLSILDQALSYGNNVNAQTVREMLGLSNIEQIYDVFDALVHGKINECLKVAKELYSQGADPGLLIIDLLNICHTLAKLKHGSEPELAELELNRSKELAKKLEISTLARLWQMLLKGYSEIKSSFSALAALEMVLIRIAYTTSTLPPPEELLKNFNNSPTNILPVNNDSSPNSRGTIKSLTDIANLLFNANEILLYHHLKSDVSLVKLDGNSITLKLLPNAPKNLHLELQNALFNITNQKWQVITSQETGDDTIVKQEKDQQIAEIELIKNNPFVQNALNSFTEMEIADIKIKNIA